MRLRVFGLTGGMGTGKSTVGVRFRARSLPVLEADLLARRVVEPGQPALLEIRELFGPELLDSEGRLARRRLADVVFADPAARKRLEAITHPRVRALADQELAELAARGEPLACYESPLLFEVGLAETIRPLVVVTASEIAQLTRVAARDHLTPELILARISAQLPLAEKLAAADYVIDNDGAVTATLEQTDRVLDEICRQLGIDAARYPRPGA